MSSIEGYTMDPFAVAVRSFDRALSGRARQTAGALARAEAGLADARARLCVACLLPSPVSAPSPCGSGEDRHGPHAERGPCRHCALARARTLGIPDAGSPPPPVRQIELNCHGRRQTAESRHSDRDTLLLGVIGPVWTDAGTLELLLGTA